MGVDQARWLRIQEIEEEGHSLGGRGEAERGRQANESVRAGCSFLISAAGRGAARTVDPPAPVRAGALELLPPALVLPEGLRGAARRCQALLRCDSRC